MEHHLGAGEVARDVDEDGTGSSGRGDVERLAEGTGEVIGGLKQEAVLDHRHGDADDVRLLERVGADDTTRDLTRDDDHGHGVHEGGRDAGDSVRGAGAGGDEHDADLAGGASVAVGHVGRTLLVACQDVVDFLAVVERVVDLDGLATGIAKERVDALGLETGDDGLGAGHRLSLVLGLATWAERPSLYRELAHRELLPERRHPIYAPLSALETSFAYFARTPWSCLGAGATNDARRASSSSSETSTSSRPPSMSTVIMSPS